MVQSLFLGAARALLAGTLLVAWSPAPLLAHGLAASGPRASGVGRWSGHWPRAYYGRGDFGQGWRWGWNGWDRYDLRRFGWGHDGRGRYGWGRNGTGYGYGLGYWSGADGYAEPTVVGVGGAPLVFAPSLTVYAPAASPSGDAAEAGGGCVIHKLEYDPQGHYVGERQYSAC